MLKCTILLTESCSCSLFDNILYIQCVYLIFNHHLHFAWLNSKMSQNFASGWGICVTGRYCFILRDKNYQNEIVYKPTLMSVDHTTVMSFYYRPLYVWTVLLKHYTLFLTLLLCANHLIWSSSDIILHITLVPSTKTQ